MCGAKTNFYIVGYKIEETETKSIPSILTYVINRNYSTILATLQITSYALGV
jgi:hypothetical protein